MRENGAEPRRGLATLMENERQVMARFQDITASRLGPVAVDGDCVAIPWAFEFALPDGARIRLEEVAWQRWSGEKIVEERFFYDPAQLASQAS
jgi:ketosteroid isomerase-like protein